MISDNDLLLYHYGDGLDASERERIGAALHAQPELTARLHRLVAQLDAAVAFQDVSVPVDVEQRWQHALDRATATPIAPPRSVFSQPFARAAGIAAVVTLIGVAFRIGIGPTRDSSEQTPAQTASASNTTRDEHGLGWHLAATERQLTELDTASDEQRARLIETVIAQNRLYALAAENMGDQRLARALRSFAPILENLATDRSSDDIAQLNFELRVMQARLATHSTPSANTQPLDL